MSSERIPSVNELAEVQRAVWGLFELSNWQCGGMSDQEERVLPYIVPLADALRLLPPLS